MLPILNQSFWRDEAFSALLSEKSPLQMVILTAQDQSPPLYLLLLHYWMLWFGKSEVAIRSLSFLFHIGTVFVIFLLARKLTKSLIPSVLIAVAILLNPFLLEYAFEARAYSLLAFLTALTVYGITIRKYWLASIALAASILSHNFGIFNAFAVGLWWMWSHRYTFKQNLQDGILLFIFPFFTLLGWGTVIWNQWVRVGKGFWIPQATSAVFLNTLKVYTVGDLTYPTHALLQLISFIIFIFAMTYWLWKKEKEHSHIPSLLASVALIPLIVTYIISALFIPIYFERYLIGSLPILILLAGYSIYKLFMQNEHRRTFLVVFVSCYLILLIQASEQIISLQPKPAINWAVKQIVSQAQPGDVIIPKSVLNYLETKWYVDRANSNLPVYAYSQDGKIPFYIGSVLYDKDHIITSKPKNTRYWEIEPDGGYKLVNSS